MSTSIFKRPYTMQLIVSGVLIIALFTLVISQILKLKSSSDKIILDIEQTEIINSLLLNLANVETELQNNSLNINFLDSIENINQNHIAKLSSSQPDLEHFAVFHKGLYQKIKDKIGTGANTQDRDEILKLIHRGRNFKTALLQHNIKNVRNSSKFLRYQNQWFTWVFTIATVLGFLILGATLWQIYKSRREINEKSSILDAILENTNDVANFYEPVFDKNDQLTDFKITYASKTNVSITDIPYKEIIGKKVSEVYPFLKPSGLFQQLVHSYKDQVYFEKDLEVPIKDEVRYFKARYIPVHTGLQVLVTDLTSLYLKQEELEAINEELTIKNNIFQEAEEAANLGSYIWFMREDHTIMSDNVYRILGYEPQSFPMSAAKFREFAHPDDLDNYDRVVTEALEEGKPIDFTFRIITADNKIKYIHTKGNFGERDGDTIMVGVLQDVTERTLNENKLKAQNIKLASQNMELESFNRVASHDLQEPLRKIQMFISRIKDTTVERLNERGQLYFQKIEGAATRMRSLINNLLAFSRVDNTDIDFELTDLKTVFDDVVETFSEALEDHHIKVELPKKLPQLYCIPFLLEQLFTNLIGNAIKYRDESRKTRIVIEASKVSVKQIPQKFIKAHKYYHVIKVMDNGIGFTQKYSDKIFELFQRLHDKGEYSGTGIGLAICKKIVLKHRGHIYATSIPDKGTIFTVYLPSGKI